VEAIFWKKKKGNSPRELGSAIWRGELTSLMYLYFRVQSSLKDHFGVQKANRNIEMLIVCFRMCKNEVATSHDKLLYFFVLISKHQYI
jgi:hypothetical protein